MVFGCVAWAAERLVFGVEVRFARSSFIFLYAVLAGLVSRWCLVVSHGLPKGRFLVWRCVLHGKVTLESFLALRVWLVGLESCWGFPVSDAC